MMNKKRIKIAYIIDSINSVAGTEKQLIQMLERLDEELFESILICLRRPSGTFKVDKGSFKYLELGLDRLMSFSALVKFVWLVFYLRKEKIDILQTYFIDASVLGVVAGKVANVREIICCRRDLGFWHTRKTLKTFRIINRFVTRFQVNSCAVKQYLVESEGVPPEKIDVIENGIDFKAFKEGVKREDVAKNMGADDGDYIVGIVANLNRRVKRVDVFLKAAAEVAWLISKVSFVVLGDGYLRNELEGMAERLGIAKKVFFVGRRDEIQAIIMAWDIGVISSDSEGFCNAVMEYMAAGIGVVATNVGGNKELIEDGLTGILVPPGDHKRMADGIYRLLYDKEGRRIMGKEGQRVIKEKYDWEMKIDEVEGYYQSLIGNGKCCVNDMCPGVDKAVVGLKVKEI